MAPLAIDIPDLGYSSLELDSRSTKPFDLAHYLDSLTFSEREALTSRADFSQVFHKRSQDGTPILSPSDTFRLLTAREAPKNTQTMNPASGSVDPNNINMKGIQAVFALIGVFFVVGGIWFFFWAKNGGFQFRKGDWDEYKSTVLRRKGPNGTTLSNATKSTKLGGGSVVGQGYSDDGSTSWEGTNTMTDMSSEAPVIKEKKSKKSQKANAKDEKLYQMNEANWEGGHDNDVRAYRHERVAKVGGLNRDSDAKHYGTDYSHSDVHSQSQRNSFQAPPQYFSRNASPEKRQSRRDFSYGDEAGFNAAPPPPQHQQTRPSRYRSPEKPARTTRVPGDFAQAEDFSDVQSQNTKSYHHPLPGLGGQQKAGGGYRRDRRDSLDD